MAVLEIKFKNFILIQIMFIQQNVSVGQRKYLKSLAKSVYLVNTHWIFLEQINIAAAKIQK